MANLSPLPTPSQAIQLVDFYDAIQAVRAGGKATKAEWNEPRMILVMLHDDRTNKDIVCINCENDKLAEEFHPYVPSAGDIDGLDFIIF